jgi:hypothetical protein
MRIDVPSTVIRSGALLDIGTCARHGVPATRARNRRFSTEMPGIVALLVFCSLFLVLLVAAAFQKEVRGPVPECDRCATAYRRRMTTMWVGVVGGPALAVTSAFLPFGINGLVLLAGVVLLVVGIGSGIRADLARVRGTLNSDLVWVELRGVDATFGAAVQDRVQSAPELDPWVIPQQ